MPRYLNIPQDRESLGLILDQLRHISLRMQVLAETMELHSVDQLVIQCSAEMERGLRGLTSFVADGELAMLHALSEMGRLKARALGAPTSPAMEPAFEAQPEAPKRRTKRAK